MNRISITFMTGHCTGEQLYWYTEVPGGSSKRLSGITVDSNYLSLTIMMISRFAPKA